MLNDDKIDELVDAIVTCAPWNHLELKEYVKGFLEECEDEG